MDNHMKREEIWILFFGCMEGKVNEEFSSIPLREVVSEI
jgi:hypothetical protein